MRHFYLKLSVLAMLMVSQLIASAQQYNDGPIQLQVRVREIRTFFDATDITLGIVGADPDELTYKLWARDVADLDGQGWTGGQCLTQNFNPSAGGLNSQDFNYTMFSQNYTGAAVPQYFDVRIDAWEDDSDDPTCRGGRCDFDQGFCCGVIDPIFGACLGVSQDDDFRCDGNPFKTDLDYRLGPPCQWYDHGFVVGSCSNNLYRPHIESYWRYTKGTSCTDAIALASIAGSSVLHFNSNICYSNNYGGSPGNDVFYTFTVTQPTGVTISTCNATNFDTYLYLLDANCNTIIASNDNACSGSASEINTVLCAAGTYTIVVDGANAGAQGTFTLTVTDNPSLLLDFNVTTTAVSCSGAADGDATVNIVQGIPPYTYAWGPGSFPTTSTISNVAAGAYSVTVTDGAGCSLAKTFIIGSPQAISVSATPTDPICNGGSNGSILVSASGGTPPYQYSIDGVNFQGNATFSNLSAGSYTLTVQDQNGCQGSLSGVVLNNPPASIQPNLTVTDISCFGLADGSVVANPTNGNAPYTYSLDGLPFVSTNSFLNISLGTHTLTIQDNLGCQVTTSFNIGQPTALNLLVQSTTAVSCNGGSDGEVTVVASGGTAPYSYSIDGVNFQPASTFSNLSANNYNVTVRDANGCEEVVTVTITQPTVLIASILFKIDVTCNGFGNGLVVATASGGTGPYEYSIDGIFYQQSGAFSNLSGGTYTITVRDNNGCTAIVSETILDPAPITATADIMDATCNGIANGAILIHALGGTPPYRYSQAGGVFQTDSNFTGLDAGTYQFTVRDRNLCEEVFTFTVGFTTAITASAQVTAVSCNGGNDGSITASVSGGAAPYTYSINNGAFGNVNTFGNLSAGSYLITARDNNGCIDDTTVVVTEPAVLSISLDAITNAACFNTANGAITVTVTGGTPQYSYSWNNGVFTNEDISGLAPGNYTLVVTDANNCSTTQTFTVAAPPQLFVTLEDSSNISCAGETDGYLRLDVTGGNAPYSYNWSNGDTIQDVANLSAGTYAVTVTDANGCSLVNTYSLTQPVAITASLTGNSSGQICQGANDAVLVIAANGGVGQLEYSIDGFNFQASDTFNNIGAGTFTGFVRDASGCVVATNSVTISEGGAIAIDYADQEITLGESVQLIALLNPTTINVVSTSWTPADGLSCTDCLAPVASPRQTTTYTVTITDDQGCTATTTVTVTVNEDFQVLAPNIFTPNGDGNNDNFDFYAFGATTVEVRVFNRWGAQVYYNPNQASGVGKGWDGKYNGNESPEGTYVYIFDIVYANGEVRQQTGSVTLVR